MGTKKTLEFRRDRLVGLGQYADGLRLSVSNRQTASLSRFAQGSSPTIAAALRRDCERLDMAKLLTPKHGGVYLPGIRDEIRAHYESEVLRGDPRLMRDLTPHMSSEERRQANAASPAIRQAQRTLDRLDAGEDIEDGRPSAREWPELADVPWYADPTVRRVIVSANDVVRPVWD
jgi:hypothetical protein